MLVALNWGLAARKLTPRRPDHKPLRWTVNRAGRETTDMKSRERERERERAVTGQ